MPKLLSRRRFSAAAALVCLFAGAAPAAAEYRPPQPSYLEAGLRPGIDIIHVGLDSDASPQRGALVRSGVAGGGGGGGGARSDRAESLHHIYKDLETGLAAYRESWGALPQVHIPAGPALRPGATGPRVAMLRHRLGLPEGSRFDAELAGQVRAYKRAHGLADTNLVDSATIASLNLGPEHYERLILVNMERARALPTEQYQRYILVDAAAARLWLYEDGKPVDSMKAVVGKISSQTPMLAAAIRGVELNPYWNVPPDLVPRLIAPRVLEDGFGYLRSAGYQVLSDWSSKAQPLEPDAVDWRAVAGGRELLRVRQLPGPTNSMGEIKFLMNNPYGIFLHDTPNRELFAERDRWLSNGCVRVEDAGRLSRWLFGKTLKGQSDEAGQVVALDEPVPVFITYLTAAPAGNGVAFRSDPYARDRQAIAALFGSEKGMQTASRD